MRLGLGDGRGGVLYLVGHVGVYGCGWVAVKAWRAAALMYNSVRYTAAYAQCGLVRWRFTARLTSVARGAGG